jgi:hypothetical protein
VRAFHDLREPGAGLIDRNGILGNLPDERLDALQPVESVARPDTTRMIVTGSSSAPR